METTKRKVYLVYSGDDIPYEPVHVIASFLDKDKAEEFVEKLKEEDEKNEDAVYKLWRRIINIMTILRTNILKIQMTM